MNFMFENEKLYTRIGRSNHGLIHRKFHISFLVNNKRSNGGTKTAHFNRKMRMNLEEKSLRKAIPTKGETVFFFKQNI